MITVLLLFEKKNIPGEIANLIALQLDIIRDFIHMSASPKIGASGEKEGGGGGKWRWSKGDEGRIRGREIERLKKRRGGKWRARKRWCKEEKRERKGRTRWEDG